MSTLRLPPDEFEIVRKAAAILQGYDIPPWPNPEALRSWLSENVTIVKPGETLVIRVAPSMTARQVAEYQRALNDALEFGVIPFRTVVVPGESLGVVQADSGA